MFTESNKFVRFEKKVWLATPTMHGEELKWMTDAFNKNWMSTVGENINEVERIVAEKIGCKYAVGLATGTASLHLAMKLAGIKRGDTVFCSDMTFSATVNPVVYEGGEPVFIDTERDTWNMDPVALEKAFETEEAVDDFTAQMAENHIRRLSKGSCTPEVGAQYLSLSTNVERIADHYINVAKTIKSL